VKSRKYIHTILSILVAVSLLMGGNGRAIAQTQEPPPPPRADGLYFNEGRPSPSDRKAAAETNKSLGLKPGVAGEGMEPSAVGADGNYVPHFFGPYANYANSPLPKGAITEITVDAGGSGYTSPPTVVIDDVYGTGSGATATAIVAGGTVTA